MHGVYRFKKDVWQSVKRSYLMRWKETKVVREIMKINVEWKRGRGRPKKKWLDVIEYDMRAVRRGCRKSRRVVVTTMVADLKYLGVRRRRRRIGIIYSFLIRILCNIIKLLIYLKKFKIDPPHKKFENIPLRTRVYFYILFVHLGDEMLVYRFQ
jgi:hypothetical protein